MKINMYKGQIENFPPEIVEKMLYYQEKQGNKRDVSVFENLKSSGEEGFMWCLTEEGDDFWTDVIDDCNFDVFFAKYPKSQLEIGKYYKYESDKDWAICKIISKTEGLYRCVGINNRKMYQPIYYISDKYSLKPATELEIEWLDRCIKENKYVDKPNYENEVVHCETQEQWDFIRSKCNTQHGIYNLNWEKRDCKSYPEGVAISINNSSYCGLNYWKNNKANILSFQEWCDKFGHQFNEFKVGDWVCAKGTGHTENNDSFPIDVAWKIGEIKPMFAGIKDSIWVDKINNPNGVKGGCTNKNDIRKALLHEIPQVITDCSLPKHLQIDNTICDRIANNSVFGAYAPSLQDVISSTKPKGLIVRTIEPKQVKQEIKLVPIKLSNHSRLKLR